MHSRKFSKNKNRHKTNYDENVTDPFYMIADEIVFYIFYFLDVADLLILCSVSLRMRKFASDDKIWERFIEYSLVQDNALKKSNQLYMTLFCAQRKTSKIKELFNKVREEELRFQYLSHYSFERDFHTFPTPLLLSYAFYLEVNPLAYTELGRARYIEANVSYMYEQDIVSNHLLKKLPIIYHSDILILRELYRFLSRVFPSSQGPSTYIHAPAENGHDFPLLYLYVTFKKCAEQNSREMIFFKDASFFRELNNFLTQDDLQGDKLIVFSKTLIAHPEMLYTQKISKILKRLLNYLNNTDVTSDRLFKYYQNSLHVTIGCSYKR